ncbi:fatty acid synthase-like [Amblyomma americanum]
MAEEEIVITGFSARFPQADDLAEFKEKLYAGVDFVTDDEARWPRGHLGLPKRSGKIRDLSVFDARFFGVHPKQAHQMDPQMRLLMETSYEAIVDAGYDPETLRGRNIGVFVGCSDSESGEVFSSDADKVDGYNIIGCSRALFSNRVSYVLDFCGPSISVDTACSSTMTALNQAMQALRSGQCEAALVAGCNVNLKPTTALSYQRLGMLSPDGKCMSFDSRGDGFTRSETVGAFFLQRVSEARRIYAKVIHTKATVDGYKVQGITYPSAKAQKKLLRDTYSEANVDPRKLEYIEAHGTGTKAGDQQEMEAIASVFCQPGRARPLMVGAVKSNVGHGEAASGLSSIAKVVLAMETGTIAGNLHFEEANPNIPSLHDGSVKVVANCTPFNGGMVGLNSFGIGGSGAHVILESNLEPRVECAPRESPALPRLILMCGRSQESLMNTLDRMEAEGPYPDAAYALLNRVGQPSIQRFPYRGFVVVPADGTRKEAVKVVEQAQLEKRPLWFVFSGMGCQWNGMARQMMHFEVFARSIRKSADVLKQFGIELTDVVTSDEVVNNNVASVLASVAAVQVALVDLLRAVGVQPDGVLGHSVGETACAYADNCLTAEQCVLCAYWRGHCVDAGNVQGGAMAIIGLTWEEATKRCRDGVVPACHNAEDSVTISGPADAVAALVAELKAERVFVREFDSMNVAFHSKYVESIGPPIREALEKVVPEPRRRSDRWVSTSVTARRWHEPAAQFASGEYYVNNLLSPVLFRDALQHVPDDAILIEIAPHCLLKPILTRTLGSGATCLGLMKRDADNLTFFLSTLGKLHTLGVQLDLSTLYPPVPWPVPRGTPPISHLVSWDHSQRWTVAKWSDFPGNAQSTEDVVEVDLEANEGDAYLTGHQLDGRILFPAAGYLVLAWKYLAKCSSKPFQEVPVTFENVTLHRAIILPRRGPVRLVVNIMRASGEFEICEAGKVAANGRIRMAEEEEKILFKETPEPPVEAVTYELDTKDIYKEFRLRGYEYGGSFQGILQADLEGSFGKIKWEDNWVTFLDSMLQFRILANPQRVFRLPVKIQSCRVDPELHVRVARGSGDAGMHMVHDGCLNSYRAGGVAIRGLKETIAPRPRQQPVPRLDEYKFVPYIDDEESAHERETCVREYVEMCSVVTGRIISTSGKNTSDVIKLEKNSCKPPGKVPSRNIETPEESRIMLRVLTNIEKNMESPASTLASTVQSALAACENDLDKDLLNTALFQEDPLRHLLDVAVENTSAKRIRVVELALEQSGWLLAPLVCSLLPLSNTSLKIEYIIAHPNPESLSSTEVAKGARKVVWDMTSKNRTDLSEADLIVVRNAPSEISCLEALAEHLSMHCNDRAFILLGHRTTLTPAEVFLSNEAKVPLAHYAKEIVVSVFAASGFCLVGRKSNNFSAVLLLRKPNLTAAGAHQGVVRVENSSFKWVDTLKTKILQCENEPMGQNVWLLADNSCASGIVGLMNCLRVERGTSRIRCLLDASQRPSSNSADLMQESLKNKKILERDLVMNVYRDGQWGSFRHLTTQRCGEPRKHTEYAFLDVQTRGDLSTLHWLESPLSCTTPSEHPEKVFCSVCYAPLNFRDVMLATGKLSPSSLFDDVLIPEYLLGVEFSGRDPQGRRIMGLVAAQGMATVVAADPDFLWEVPDAWSLEEASTVPAAYSTAYYALLVRGDMRPGESLLVHSGSGGVGQAAITVALSMGCIVFTTVGSKEKREFLKRRFPQLEDRHIASSRDLSFEEHVLRETKGKGVDLVLNSLSEEKLEASVRCLAAHGRFLEIGKCDLAKESSLGMSVFLKKAMFCAIQLDTVHGKGPFAVQEQRRLKELVQEGIASGVVRPLDSNPFSVDKAEEAFRFMSSGRHIGKVVLEVHPEECTPEMAPASPLVVEALARTWFYEQKSYVIIGGLGGFGLELAEWMVSRGCRKLLLSSRSGVRTGYQKRCLRRWQQSGVEVIVSTADASTEDGARVIIEEALAIGPIGGIFNLALVLREALLDNQTAELFEVVCRIKVHGTHHLDELSRKFCPELDHFVAFSSIACGHGNVGQTPYGYANSVMERICERRVADGLPGLAIQWGAIGDVGALREGKDADVAVAAYAPQRIGSCLSVLDRFFNQGKPVVSSFVKIEESSNRDEPEVKTRDIIHRISHIFGVKDPESLDPNLSLGDFGMDSLIGVEVQQTLERDYDIIMSMTEIRKLTLNGLREIGAGAGHKSPAAESEAKSPGRKDSAHKWQVPRLKLAEELIPDRVLVEMNGIEGSAALFVVHSIQGHVNALFELAAYLPIRTIGLQRTADIPVRSIKEMAAIYRQKLKKVQPTGPYHLAGYSFGAAVAFELAVQLQASGASVNSLTLLDGAPRYVAALWSHHEISFQGNETDADAFKICAFLMQYIDIDVLKVRHQLSQCATWEAMQEVAVDILLRAFPVMRLSRADVAMAMQSFRDFIMVASNYEPDAMFCGDVVLVKASRQRDMARLLPPDYGLSEFVQGKVEVKTVTGSHEQFILGQGARQCAAIISQQVAT